CCCSNGPGSPRARGDRTSGRSRMRCTGSSASSSRAECLMLEQYLLRKPLPAFRDHALARRPGIVGAEGPDVPFRILAGVVAPTIAFAPRLPHDFSAGRLGPRPERIGVDNITVASHGAPAGRARPHEQLAVFGLLRRAEHHHAVAERELGMGDGAVLSFV